MWYNRSGSGKKGLILDSNDLLSTFIKYFLWVIFFGYEFRVKRKSDLRVFVKNFEIIKETFWLVKT